MLLGGRKNTDVPLEGYLVTPIQDMQIPSTFEGTFCVFFIVAFPLYLYIFADDLLTIKKIFKIVWHSKEKTNTVIGKKSYLSLIYLESREQMSGNGSFFVLFIRKQYLFELPLV